MSRRRACAEEDGDGAVAAALRRHNRCWTAEQHAKFAATMQSKKAYRSVGPSQQPPQVRRRATSEEILIGAYRPMVYFFPKLARSTYRRYQFASNGISLAAMLDRYYLRQGDTDKEFVKEFYPVLKQCTIWTANSRPAYAPGDRLIAMPRGNVGTEWFEAPEPGWAGMTAHIGGLR
jgi:hypothetical protein